MAKTVNPRSKEIVVRTTFARKVSGSYFGQVWWCHGDYMVSDTGSAWCKIPCTETCSTVLSFMMSLSQISADSGSDEITMFCCGFSVPCTYFPQGENKSQEGYPTVLAEFSSVVADTQQYIMPDTLPVSSTSQESHGQLVGALAIHVPPW